MRRKIEVGNVSFSYNWLYLALTLVFAYAVPLAGVGFDNAEQVPQMAVLNLFGAKAASVFNIMLGLTFLATVSAFIITGPRVYDAMEKMDCSRHWRGMSVPKGGFPFMR